jgi:hypothetical protein
MAITYNVPDKGTLFDSILNKREAFLKKEKPVKSEFPPIFDSDVIDQLKTKSANTVAKQKSAPKDVKSALPSKPTRSLIPKVPAAIAPEIRTQLPEDKNVYSYLGATARKNVLWEDLRPEDAMTEGQIEQYRNDHAVAAAKAKARRADTGPKRQLDQRAKVIVKALPKSMRPLHTCHDFPHIINLIASSWHEPKLFVKTLDELLMDDRGDRQGFPFQIIVELTELREHYFTSVHPEALKLWKRL